MDNLRKAEMLIQPTVMLFNGGQTRESHPPSDSNVQLAQAVALIEIAEQLRRINNHGIRTEGTEA